MKEKEKKKNVVMVEKEKGEKYDSVHSEEKIVEGVEIGNKYNLVL